MSDDYSPQPAGEDSSESGASADDGAGAGSSSDRLEPGGGPQRVVSEQSVDDILNSLGATKSKSATDSSETATASEPNGSTTVEFDEDETSPTDGDDSDDATDETADAAENSAAANAPAESTSDAPSVEEAAASIPDDASLEDLTARVETGTVTGADVRAAEAGEGRESTPEVDEIELSMDDLEATRAHSGTDASGPAASAPDDGPLAGTIPRDGDSSAASDDADESPGLFGRIKRFFGG